MFIRIGLGKPFFSCGDIFKGVTRNCCKLRIYKKVAPVFVYQGSTVRGLL